MSPTPLRSRACATTIAFVASCLLAACSADDKPNAKASSDRDAAAKGICTKRDECEEQVELQPAVHVAGTIEYKDPPPAGGPHNPCWGSFGVHDEPLGVEHWVHNLEHGAVVYLYACPDGCPDEIDALSDLTRGRPLALVTEYSELPTKLAAVAWGYRLLTDTLDLDAFERFYAAHADHGPESIPSGPPASCGDL